MRKMTSVGLTEVCHQSSKKSVKYTEEETKMVVDYFLKYRVYLMGEKSKTILPKKKELIWKFITSKLNEVQPVKRQWYQTKKRISDIKRSIRLKNIEAKRHAHKSCPGKPRKIKYTPSEERIAAIMTAEGHHSISGTDSPTLEKSQPPLPAPHALDPILPDLQAVDNEDTDYEYVDLEGTSPPPKEEQCIMCKHQKENLVYNLDDEQPGPSHADVRVSIPGPMAQPQSYRMQAHNDHKNDLASTPVPENVASAERRDNIVHTLQPPSVERILTSQILEEARAALAIALPSKSGESHSTPSRAYDAPLTQSSRNACIKRSSEKSKLGRTTLVEATPTPNFVLASKFDESHGPPSRTYVIPVTPSPQNASIRHNSAEGMLGSPTLEETTPDPNVVLTSNSGDSHGSPSRAYDAHIPPSSENARPLHTSTISILGSSTLGEATLVPNFVSPSHSGESIGTASRAYNIPVPPSSQNASTRRTCAKGILGRSTLDETAPAPNIFPPSNSGESLGTPSRAYNIPITPSSQNARTSLTSTKSILGSTALEEVTPAPNIVPTSKSDDSHATPSRIYDAPVSQSPENASIIPTGTKSILCSRRLGEAAPTPNIVPPSNSNEAHGMPCKAYGAPVPPSSKNARISWTSTKGILGSPVLEEATPAPNLFSPSISDDSRGTPSGAYDAPATSSSENASTRCTSPESIQGSLTLKEAKPAPNIVLLCNFNASRGTPSEAYGTPATSSSENASTRCTSPESIQGSLTLKEAKPAPNIVPLCNFNGCHGTSSRAYGALAISSSENARISRTSAKSILSSPIQEDFATAPNFVPPSTSDASHGTSSRAYGATVTPCSQNTRIRHTSTKSILGSPTLEKSTSAPRIVPPSNSDASNGTPSRAYDATDTPSSQNHHTAKPLTRTTTAVLEEQGNLMEHSEEYNSILRAIQQQTEMHNQNMNTVCGWLEKIAIALSTGPCRSCADGAAQVIGQMQETIEYTNNVMKEIRDHLKTTQPTPVVGHTRDAYSSRESSDSTSPESDEQPITPSDYASSNDSFYNFSQKDQRQGCGGATKGVPK